MCRSRYDQRCCFDVSDLANKEIAKLRAFKQGSMTTEIYFQELQSVMTATRLIYHIAYEEVPNEVATEELPLLLQLDLLPHSPCRQRLDAPTQPDSPQPLLQPHSLRSHPRDPPDPLPELPAAPEARPLHLLPSLTRRPTGRPSRTLASKQFHTNLRG